eukprot:15346778-Alexandrium_andersonii.AAC.1
MAAARQALAEIGECAGAARPPMEASPAPADLPSTGSRAAALNGSPPDGGEALLSSSAHGKWGSG